MQQGPAISSQLKQQKFFNRASMLLRSGDARMAENQCREGLKKYPGDANLMCLSARANIAMHKFPEARSVLEDAIRLFPDFATAHETMGDLLMIQGQAESGRKAYEQAMRLDPARLVTHEKIARARQLEKEIGDALAAHREKHPARKPLPFEREIAKALDLERNDDGKAAEAIYRQILTRDPDHIEAARLLARIAAGKKRFRDAEIFLQRVVLNAPDYARAWVDLCNAQREQGKLTEAVDSAKRVVELAPKQPESYVLLAGAIGMLGHHEAAIEACQRALDIAPEKTGAICTMGHHQKTLGRQDEAIASYRRCIEIKPDHAEAYWSLANMKTFRFEEAEVRAMEALLDGTELGDESRAQVHNALALEYEGRTDYARAFAHFEQCNTVQRRLESYDPVDTEANYSRIIEMFDAEFLQKMAGIANNDITPIFIVGLPRSGSTLIEQILASHSQVDATHELGDLSRVMQARHRKSRKRERFPDTLADLSREDWGEAGREYLGRTEIHRGNAAFFVDKNPNNFMFAGFLKIAIPNAKIIDARRHPLDSCFGSYKQLFAMGQPFTYDLTEIGEYYLQYRRLMAHWHKVIPGFVLEVHYEQVVADLETEVRQILAFCGLPFEESCLRFHETERAVKTASSEQVRQPIYSSSVNLWRNYEDHLETLVHILEPELAALDPVDRPSIRSPDDQT
jgi:tetratricopeptide (TPR) repeat protein